MNWTLYFIALLVTYAIALPLLVREAKRKRRAIEKYRTTCTHEHTVCKSCGKTLS